MWCDLNHKVLIGLAHLYMVKRTIWHYMKKCASFYNIVYASDDYNLQASSVSVLDIGVIIITILFYFLNGSISLVTSALIWFSLRAWEDLEKKYFSSWAEKIVMELNKSMISGQNSYTITITLNHFCGVIAKLLNRHCWPVCTICFVFWSISTILAWKIVFFVNLVIPWFPLSLKCSFAHATFSRKPSTYATSAHLFNNIINITYKQKKGTPIVDVNRSSHCFRYNFIERFFFILVILFHNIYYFISH